jgi:hypothetical protein
MARESRGRVDRSCARPSRRRPSPAIWSNAVATAIRRTIMSRRLIGKYHGRSLRRAHSRNIRPLVLHTSLAPLAMLGVTVAFRRSDGIDDAYISYRYVWNVSAGHGLVFNTGQRVEGESNLLWTLLLAGMRALGMHIPSAATILGILCLAATVVLTRRYARRLGLPPAVALVSRNRSDL